MPVPVSPCTSSGASSAATRKARALRVRMAGDSPSKASKPSAWSWCKADRRSPMREGGYSVSRPPALVIGMASSSRLWPFSCISRMGRWKLLSSSACSSAGSPNSSPTERPADSRPHSSISAGLANSTRPALSTASTGSLMAASRASSCRWRRWPGRMSTTSTDCTPCTSNSASCSSSSTAGLRVGASM
ncbi:hypothetical protein D9M71_614550 [compost metagenome]